MQPTYTAQPPSKPTPPTPQPYSQHSTAIPPVGTLWTAQGGIYLGILLATDRVSRHHVIVADNTHDIAATTWQDAIERAKAPLNGFADWSLMDNRESLLAYLNADYQFDKDGWYWTATQNESTGDSAYIQTFSDGNQDWYPKSYKYCARAVRRLLIIE